MLSPSNIQGGFNSPKVIFVDAAGKTSDIYHVNLLMAIIVLI
jgi:hypothetical protein